MKHTIILSMLLILLCGCAASTAPAEAIARLDFQIRHRLQVDATCGWHGDGLRACGRVHHGIPGKLRFSF